MSAWSLLQIVIDVILMCGLVLQARRMMRPPKDDPRLSRGLQMLQSKIAVLEDLSDRTEVQVKQLTALLDQKTREVQDRIYEAEHHVQLIKRSMQKSLEVAEIFQDKIPHQEIIERQNTKKYIHAAQMAHEGKTVDQIAKVIDLPRGELELIAKINREHLVFEEDQLPAWAQAKASPPKPDTFANREAHDRVPLFTEKITAAPSVTLEQLGEEFRKARPQIEAPSGAAKPETSSLVNRFASTKIFQKAAQILEPATNTPSEHAPISVNPEAAAAADSDTHPHYPFEFKKINVSDTLG